LSIKIARTYLSICTFRISSRLHFHLMPADIIHLNDLLPKCVLVTSYLNFDLFAASHRLKCALLWSGLAVAVPAAVVGQVNTSRVDVTASPTPKPTRRRAVSVIVIAEMSFCNVSQLTKSHFAIRAKIK